MSGADAAARVEGAGWDGEAVVRKITARSEALGRWIVDDDPSPAFPLYTRANIGEVFPDVVQPLSWTLWGIPHADFGWRLALRNLGAFDLEEFTPGAMEMLGVFGGYGYLNASASRIFGARTPGLSAEAIDQSFFGGQPDVPPYEPRPGDTSPVHSERLGAMLKWLFSEPPLDDLDRMRADVEAVRAARPDIPSLSDAALFDHVLALTEMHWRRLWVRHIEATYHSTIPAGMLAGIAAVAGCPELTADVLTSDTVVDSARPAHALWALARDVTGSAALTALFDAGLPAVVDHLRAAGPDIDGFRSAFSAFLREFGFRGPNEWEMRSRAWEVDPATPLTAIATLRHAPENESPAARARARAAAKQQAAATIAARLSDDQTALGQFRAALDAAGRFFAARERTKTSCAMLTHEMRMPMWELGRRFTARGLFPAADSFALLTVSEWRAALDDPAFVPDLVRRRSAEEARLAALEPPFIVHRTVPPVETWRPRIADRPTAAAGGLLAGVPGCAGIACGRARIVVSPDQPGDFAPGDILIAPFTDPAWTPLMAAAAAVVVDVGAAVSHAVIVARELGVPCAVSVTGASRAIPDGAMVEVDGGRGTVRIL